MGKPRCMVDHCNVEPTLRIEGNGYCPSHAHLAAATREIAKLKLDLAQAREQVEIVRREKATVIETSDLRAARIDQLEREGSNLRAGATVLRDEITALDRADSECLTRRNDCKHFGDVADDDGLAGVDGCWTFLGHIVRRLRHRAENLVAYGQLEADPSMLHLEHLDRSAPPVQCRCGRVTASNLDTPVVTGNESHGRLSCGLTSVELKLERNAPPRIEGETVDPDKLLLLRFAADSKRIEQVMLGGDPMTISLTIARLRTDWPDVEWARLETLRAEFEASRTAETEKNAFRQPPPADEGAAS